MEKKVVSMSCTWTPASGTGTNGFTPELLHLTESLLIANHKHYSHFTFSVFLGHFQKLCCLGLGNILNLVTTCTTSWIFWDIFQNYAVPETIEFSRTFSCFFSDILRYIVRGNICSNIYLHFFWIKSTKSGKVCKEKVGGWMCAPLKIFYKKIHRAWCIFFTGKVCSNNVRHFH